MTLDATEAGGGGDLFAAKLMGSLLTVASSEFIGVSFIVKKKGLGCRRHPSRRRRVWLSLGATLWVGMVTSKHQRHPLASFIRNYMTKPKSVLEFYQKWKFAVLVGEIANFIEYMIESAILVMPLGALNIIVSVVLAHFTLNEKLHRALDTFNTAVVSPIYYAMFTTLTILASAIMLKVRIVYMTFKPGSKYIFSKLFLSFLLITTNMYAPLPPKIYWHIQGNDDIGQQREDDSLTYEFITVVRQDYFVY
ncbi:putative magnesium transporter NIPA7 [Zea mays]|uniref:Probable magnesium transporter n=1 Tax=Zea mays TaxID=4577 RepID=A0A3L6F9Z9_MAIZE|nr:putative magnesium transporter NIPA7 [Zea mays]